MILSDVAIKRPVFTVMVTLALMTLGILAVPRLAVDLFPDVSFPFVAVTTVYPGAGPEEVEHQVTKQVEEVVASVNNVEWVRSYSRDSVSLVIIQFDLDADAQTAAADVRDQVAGIRGRLPKDVREPIIQRIDPTAQPVLTYVVSTSRDSAETRQLVEDQIKPRIESVDGVAALTILGGREREIHVYPDPSRLEAMGLSMAQLAQQLAQEGFDLPGGRVITGGQEISVKTAGRYRSLEELRQVVVSTAANGSQIRLGEIARVENGYKEERTRTRLDGTDAVAFQIQKQSGSNTVAIVDAVQERIAKLEQTLPSDVKLLKAIDSSVFIRHTVRDVSEAILFGGAMAILVIFLFMLDWRSTVISGLALPTSVVTTFMAMWWMGFSFNIMSLMALALAIGLLIDDAVVVRENIYRHMEKGEDPVTAARKGTAEIGLAVMATTFTIVAVFVPVAFMGGIVGRFFKQFGLTITAAVLVSLFISFTLDPMLSARVVKPIKPGHHEELKKHRLFGPIVRFYDRMDVGYRGLLRWSLDHGKTVAAAASVLFIGSVLLGPIMGSEFLPAEDMGEFLVRIEQPAGTGLEKMAEVTRDVEARIRQNPHVQRMYTTIGTNDEVHRAQIRVYTSEALERPDTPQRAIQEDLRRRFTDVPGLRYNIQDIGLLEGMANEAPITLFVRGEDFGELEDVATRTIAELKKIRGVRDVDMSLKPGKPEASFRVDRSRASDLGVPPAVVAQTLRLGLEGEVVAKFRDGDRDYDVRLQLPPEERRSVDRLTQLAVPATGRRVGAPVNLAAMMSMQPRLVRVGDVTEVDRNTTPATIERRNRQRQITISAQLSGRSLGDVVTEAQGVLDKLEKPAGVTFEFAGMAEMMQDTFVNMGLALITAILFIYFVLASQFESFIHPLTIMMALPLAVVGALLGLFLAQYPIGMSSLIGIILLMGLVTKNAILLVDYTNELRETRGLSMRDALLEAGPTRLRPILMTSAAMVLGMLPSALARGEGSALRAPMALAVIGGVITSTVLTLLVVPVVYTWMDRFTLKKKLFAHGHAAASADALHAPASEEKAP